MQQQQLITRLKTHDSNVNTSVRSMVITCCWTRHHITVCNPVRSVTDYVIYDSDLEVGVVRVGFFHVLVQV